MIELACISDGAYLRHTAAMLHSVLAASPSSRFSVRLLHSEPIGGEDRLRLQRVVGEFGARIDLLKVEPETVAPLPEGYFPRSVWLRILLPELLPDSDRILYLDSDLVAADDLQPLWDTDISGYLLAAVTNPLYPFMPPYPQQTLGIANPRDYFNSGVLLMNLRRMREERIAEQLAVYAVAHPGNWFPDQDALNIVCRDRWLGLHPRWNVQSTLFELRQQQIPLPPEQVREALAQPAVIHFIGPFKPWHYLCRHPHQKLYLEHARATPWGEPRIEGRTLRNAILRRLPMVWIDRWMRTERALGRARLRIRTRLSAGLGAS